MKNVTLNELRDLLDDLGIACKKKDDVLLASLPADEDFGHDVSVLFALDGTNDLRMRAVAWSGSFQAPRADRVKALEFCNAWNTAKAVPRAYLDKDGDFSLDLSLFTDVEIDASYIKENFIRLFLSTSWHFFKDAGQEFA